MKPRTLTLKWFARDRRGVAAVEFALLLPLMVAALIMTLDVSLHVVNRTRMHSAIRSGIQYLMDNGRDLDQLKSIVEMSWSSAPADAAVTTQRYCLCVEIPHACNVLCADDTAPDSYFSVNTSGSLDGFIVSTSLAASENVRVR